jgi:hypothetical protein
MHVTVPSSKNKRYLSGFDWVMGVIDHILKKATCSGNASQIIFELDSLVEAAALQNSLSRFLKLFPVVQGRVSRDLNLAPYWRFPGNNHVNGVDLDVHHLENSSLQTSVWSVMEEWVNRPFRDEQHHLAFHLIYTKSPKTYFGMTFDHRLFDARGAESFMHLFQQYIHDNGNTHITEEVRLTASADLSQWKEKFEAGRHLNRKIIALSKTSLKSIPVTLNHSEKKRGFQFRLVCFDKKDTERIFANAFEEAGYLMVMPYFLAVAAQTLHELFERKGLPADSYIVPVSVDKRSSEDIKRELFFNYASMFLFQIHAHAVHDRKALIRDIKRQMYEQVQSCFPENLLKAAALLRIAPVSFLKNIFLLPFEGKFASFSFSHIGRCSYQSPEFMGAKINNFFHMPRVPVPPGIGIFFNSYNGALNVVISWLDGLVGDDEIFAMECNLRKILCGK